MLRSHLLLFTVTVSQKEYCYSNILKLYFLILQITPGIFTKKEMVSGRENGGGDLVAKAYPTLQWHGL